MSNRNIYIEKMKLQLDELDEKMAKLEAKEQEALWRSRELTHPCSAELTRQ